MAQTHRRSSWFLPTVLSTTGRGAVDVIGFLTLAMRSVFSDENCTQKYLDIEAALARAQAHLGIIPAEAATEIARNCHRC